MPRRRRSQGSPNAWVVFSATIIGVLVGGLALMYFSEAAAGSVVELAPQVEVGEGEGAVMAAANVPYPDTRTINLKIVFRRGEDNRPPWRYWWPDKPPAEEVGPLYINILHNGSVWKTINCQKTTSDRRFELQKAGPWIERYRCMILNPATELPPGRHTLSVVADYLVLRGQQVPLNREIAKLLITKSGNWYVLDRVRVIPVTIRL